MTTENLNEIAIQRDKKKASFALLIIQTFATLGFAVLYSTLVLYATKKLGFTDVQATVIMGVFGAFNYGLHLLGGLLGGRLMSNRNLFIIGMVLQVIGCYFIAQFGHSGLYWGLALFLTGSGLNVTCINMMLTQRFHPDDPGRESAFLYNYAGMNLGFFIGFAVAGYFQNLADYKSLFMFATLGNLAAVLATLVFWKSLSDLTTPLIGQSRGKWLRSFAIGLIIIATLIPIIKYLLVSASLAGHLVVFIAVLVALVLIILTIKHKKAHEKGRMVSYLILAVGSLVFWSLYSLAPMGLSLFIDRNVDLTMSGFKIAPQWIQNINTVVIVIGGPLMAMLFNKLRKKGINIDIPMQFSSSLICIGLGFLVLPLGIHFANPNGMVAVSWVGLSYILQSIGELLISPIGYAMVGKLAPKKYQGGMMGAWMLVTGVASIVAASFSEMMPGQGAAATTDAGYASVFGGLGLAACVAGVILIFMTPLLRKLIKN
ncbi:oligopeptide:H+ symporter [Vibrio sp. SS-MA-C1-2]|uniref:peptide MFS transporter n=1 Tax=Vibrio sp. SS-MA-C1-2 TaxID=2908646 RepID=UPI001F388F08|nr:oligopeptide:H+ symporter [Vibrio sp. SS-MA-C1-2]UJF16958.1 oligopeptide:H+ symporter [Vibrio sp. SS-MA-C1-2]